MNFTTVQIHTILCVPCEQGCLQAVLTRQGEVDGLSSLAQQVLEETYISSRVSVTATQLTARYHSLLLNIQVRKSLRCTVIHMSHLSEYSLVIYCKFTAFVSSITEFHVLKSYLISLYVCWFSEKSKFVCRGVFMFIFYV